MKKDPSTSHCIAIVAIKIQWQCLEDKKNFIPQSSADKFCNAILRKVDAEKSQKQAEKSVPMNDKLMLHALIWGKMLGRRFRDIMPLHNLPFLVYSV